MNTSPPSWLTDPAGHDRTHTQQQSDDTGTMIYQAQMKIKNIVNAAIEPSADLNVRLAAIKAATNPLLEAAKPLLATLSQMPQSLDSTLEVEAFRQLLEQDIVNFQTLGNKAGLRREHVITASYCLCTALDEAASSTSWGGSQPNGELGAWSSRLLASTLHSDIDGGTKFFLLTSRLIKTPDEHMDLLELFYHILCLGFQGQYSAQPDGQQRLDAIRHHLLMILTAVRDPVSRSLSPNSQPASVARLQKLGKVPAWITVSVLTLFLFTEYSWYQFSLSSTRADVIAHIRALENALPAPAAHDNVLPVAVSHAVPELRPHLSELLASEIQKGQVTIHEEDDHSTITLKGDMLFASGKDDINQHMSALLKKVSIALGRLPGQISIIGHTDNVPVRSFAFADNAELSLSRAQKVARRMTTSGISASRLHVTGAGHSRPVASNKSAAGRARNRRIDIILFHNDMMQPPASNRS